MQKEYIANSLKDLPGIAKDIISLVKKPVVFLFYGEMGVGKTTFIQVLCKELGVEEAMSSPTFSLVNEYQSNDGNLIYHFDFYRVEQPEEALDIGAEEYFYSGNYCFIEWPEKINNYLPDDALEIHINEENQIRKITLKD